MSAPYELLSCEAIRKWLKGLVDKGGTKSAYWARPTIEAVAEYMGISKGTVRWLVARENYPISAERQRLFSRVISEIENGQIVFERVAIHTNKRGGQRSKKVARRVENPKPIQRYVVHFGEKGVTMIPAPRPPIATTMPTIASMLAPKRRSN